MDAPAFLPGEVKQRTSDAAEIASVGNACPLDNWPIPACRSLSVLRVS
jgi:hypothetical protein